MEGTLDWNTPRPLAYHETWYQKMIGYPVLIAESAQGEVMGYAALQPQATSDESVSNNLGVQMLTKREQILLHVQY